jgi:hypothetical protein
VRRIHSVPIFQSGINGVAAQIFLRFQQKSLWSEGNFPSQTFSFRGGGGSHANNSLGGNEEV